MGRLAKKYHKLFVLGGVLHGGKAFTGPEVLHIDLTNRCNFNCIVCWCRSPLLGERGMPEWERKLILPLGLIRDIFDDIADMGGLQQVKLVGGGEPFMHPDLIKIVEYIKRKDRRVHIDINTNFSLVDEDKADALLNLGLDSFTVSIWAGSPQVYSAVHPNQSVETFYKIKKVLKFISELKKKQNVSYPRIILHNVIFKYNYRDVRQMIDFALEVGADEIQLVPMDPVKNATDSLLLSDSEKKELLLTLYEVRKNHNHGSLLYTEENGRFIALTDFEAFIRRSEQLDTRSGVYDEYVVNEIPCYVGWLFARIMGTGDVVPCCKGHRMSMGNVYNDRFRNIWFSPRYNQFRKNCLELPKVHPYFSRIGNDATSRTGCYNCDNLWQNIPMHENISCLRRNRPLLSFLCSKALKIVFK
jgi:MoaA/NifB/PqqE/SkfB family radical SAM enzyme